MIKMKATNLKRVSYLVLDEADRMFDLGFGKFLFFFKLVYFIFTKRERKKKNPKLDQSVIIFDLIDKVCLI